jgi:cytochrome c oxidase cbb3-type subunit 1
MVLRFTVFGAMCYTAVSLQGSLEAIRSFQQVAHFTHYTIGHAHLGVHAFLTMILFGAMYYIVPRVARWDWPRPAFIKVHFWVTGTGVLLYTIATCTGGWWQGLVLNMSARPFIDSTVLVKPFLAVRTGSGILMGIGHFIFALLYLQVLLRQGSPRWGGSQP